MADGPLKRLQQHSGLVETARDTLCEFTSSALQGEPAPNIELITADIITCLQQLNLQRPKADPPLALVYAMSGIIGECLSTIRKLEGSPTAIRTAKDLIRASWRIQCAWDAFLAGDIDDLQEHVELEEGARFGSA